MMGGGPDVDPSGPGGTLLDKPTADMDQNYGTGSDPFFSRCSPDVLLMFS